MLIRRLAATAAALLLVLSTAACSDDGGGEDVTADQGSAAKACSPVGEDLEDDATQEIPVVLDEFRFAPESLTTEPGIVTFVASNEGAVDHELAFLPGGGEVPVNAEGEPDEDALAEAGAFELEAFGPGQTCKATYELAAGTYALFCIVTTDGQPHDQRGMRGTLVVG